jgi:hypothetical protein
MGQTQFKRGDRRLTGALYQEQFDTEGYLPQESRSVLMRDAVGDMPGTVGTFHWTNDRGWEITFDPRDLEV